MRAWIAALSLLGTLSTGATQTNFSQGLWRSQDPRISYRNGSYYSVHWENTHLKLYKHVSLVDRGVGKTLPPHFPVQVPFFVDSLGTISNQWAAVGDSVWTLPAGEDPYDNIEDWQAGPPTSSPGSFDYAVLHNPQAGAYQNHWYLMRAAHDSDPNINNDYAESIYVSEIVSLTAAPVLTNPNNDFNNRIVVPHNLDSKGNNQSSWMDIIAEAPSPVVNPNGDVFLLYAGNGTQNDGYAVGISVLKRGTNPASPNSWLNQNANACLDGTTSPAFQRTIAVYGPGVAQVFSASDGSPWMIYHSKTWSTGLDATQDINEMFNRYISVQPVTWSRSVACNGTTYLFPDLGTPVAAGSLVNLPSGDPGVTDQYVKIEAEDMISTGFILGNGVRTLPRQLIVLDDPNSGLNPEVIARQDPNCSNGAKVTHFLELAQDQPTLPNRSSLLWRNAPQASYLAVTAATQGDSNLDFYVNGMQVGQLNFADSGGNDIFKTYQFAVNIPHGAEVRLVYERGRSVDADIDYIEMSPTAISVPSDKVGGTTAAPQVIAAASTSAGTTSTGGGTAGSSTGGSSTGGGSGTGGSGTGLLPQPDTTTGATTGGVAEPAQANSGYGCASTAPACGAMPFLLAWLWSRRRQVV